MQLRRRSVGGGVQGVLVFAIQQLKKDRLHWKEEPGLCRVAAQRSNERRCSLPRREVVAMPAVRRTSPGCSTERARVAAPEEHGTVALSADLVPLTLKSVCFGMERVVERFHADGARAAVRHCARVWVCTAGPINNASARSFTLTEANRAEYLTIAKRLQAEHAAGYGVCATSLMTFYDFNRPAM